MNKMINKTTMDYPVIMEYIRLKNPGFLSSKSPSDDELGMVGYANVFPTIKPRDSNLFVAPDPIPAGYVMPSLYNGDTHKCVEGVPTSDGTIFSEQWDIITLSAEEVAKAEEYVTVSKGHEIRAAFLTATKVPVDSNGFTWNGGEMSAMRLKGKADTLVQKSLTEGDIHDIDNIQHTLTVAQILDIAADISVAYEVQFDLYQAKKNEIVAANGDCAAIRLVTYS